MLLECLWTKRKAAEWLQKAAEQECAQAQYNLEFVILRVTAYLWMKPKRWNGGRKRRNKGMQKL